MLVKIHGNIDLAPFQTIISKKSPFGAMICLELCDKRMTLGHERFLSYEYIRMVELVTLFLGS